MQKFNSIKSIPVYLPIVNVDTDMIIPKQFLKTIKRTGLGKSLFFEMRYDQNGNLIAKINPIHFRPTEVDLLLGNASKAKAILKWKPEHSFDNLVKVMIEADFNRTNKGLRLQ